jgi:flagellum-specific peptidoglycan hydrolase FlgJ
MRALIITLIAVFIVLGYIATDIPEAPAPIDPVIVELDVWQTIQKTNIQHPHIVYAQFKLESGTGTSPLATSHNNLFGMRCPKNRPTTGVCINGWLSFRTWDESIIDYALWQSCYARNLTESEYLSKLGRVYATDSNYVSKIKYLIR